MSIVKFRIEDNGVKSTVIVENSELNAKEICNEFCLVYYKIKGYKNLGDGFKQIIKELDKYDDFKIVQSIPTFTLNSEIRDMNVLLNGLNIDEDEFMEFVEWSES